MIEELFINATYGTNNIVPTLIILVIELFRVFTEVDTTGVSLSHFFVGSKRDNFNPSLTSRPANPGTKIYVLRQLLQQL
ncbi:hypothetical protein OnM2_033055 [Erysiphe neolycopersici]|uniref:Uncharacterized protein n=1 Tax=Erysiphe neolycopersici TaxID=212602 RepID=A0A420HYJ6_9PEZI|nr:hypothetical protein OnM2_033055 [Erysiphe neolycopersici]